MFGAWERSCIGLKPGRTGGIAPPGYRYGIMAPKRSLGAGGTPTNCLRLASNGLTKAIEGDKIGALSERKMKINFVHFTQKYFNWLSFKNADRKSGFLH